jgi:hypothetical protein
MKRSIPFGILIIILISSCKNNDSFTEYSTEAVLCIQSRDSSLLENLDNFEKYLVHDGLIQDVSQPSYIDLIDKYQKGKIELNVPLMSEYVFKNNLRAWDYLSPGKFAIFIGCITAGKQGHEEKNYYNLAGKVLMNSLSSELQTIDNEQNLSTEADYLSIEYSDIPEEMFDNEFIHYCFLVSLYQLLL